MSTHDDQSLIRTAGSLGKYVLAAVVLAVLAAGSYWFLGRAGSPAGVAATAAANSVARNNRALRAR